MEILEVDSLDGTRIGCELLGDGPPLLAVHGTTADRVRAVVAAMGGPTLVLAHSYGATRALAAATDWPPRSSRRTRIGRAAWRRSARRCGSCSAPSRRPI